MNKNFLFFYLSCFYLIGIIALGFVSAADYKFQNKSGSDLVIIHGDTGNLTVTGKCKC